MLRVQIAVAKKSQSQSRPSNVDIYKRKVDAVTQHYEEQLKEMAEELAALTQEEHNFHLDIATSVIPSEAKPNLLFAETQSSINISDVSNRSCSRVSSFQNTPKSTNFSLFQQARLFSDDLALEKNQKEVEAVFTVPSNPRKEVSSVFKFKKTATVMNAAAKDSKTSQNMVLGVAVAGDQQGQQSTGKVSHQEGGYGTVSSCGNTPGVKGGKPSFKFVSKTASAGSKATSRAKSVGFLPVVVMGPEKDDEGVKNIMDNCGRKRSVFERDFGGLEQ